MERPKVRFGTNERPWSFPKRPENPKPVPVIDVTPLVVDQSKPELRRRGPQLRTAIKYVEWAFGERFRRGNPDHDTALVLIASAFKGPFEYSVAAYTNLPVEFIKVVLDRLRANGIITPENQFNVQWFDLDEKPEEAAISFMMDTLVGTGCMARVIPPPAPSPAAPEPPRV
jgi:hypothetical protein